MCLKGSGLPSGLCDMHSSTAPFRSGVRKQCRLLGETAQAFVKARRTHPALWLQLTSLLQMMLQRMWQRAFLPDLQPAAD